jgi:hypothetical protein
MGSGTGSVALEEIMGILSKMMQAATTAGFSLATKALPLCCIGSAWSRESNTARIVFKMSS